MFQKFSKLSWNVNYIYIHVLAPIKVVFPTLSNQLGYAMIDTQGHTCPLIDVEHMLA